MRVELANLNYCAVPFLSRAAANLCRNSNYNCVHQILDNIGLFLILNIKEASQYKNMLIFSVGYDLSSFKRKDLEKLEDDAHQPLTCWLQSQRSQIRFYTRQFHYV